MSVKLPESVTNHGLWVKLPKITDSRGNLAVLESHPFPLKRVYFMYDVPAGVSRGGHAHISLERIVVALAGCFDITIEDVRYTLRDPAKGLYIPPLKWITVDNFSAGAVLLALCSHEYDEADYLRHYGDFLRYRGRTAEGRRVANS